MIYKIMFVCALISLNRHHKKFPHCFIKALGTWKKTMRLERFFHPFSNVIKEYECFFSLCERKEHV
jgi:hypothetical protein